MDAILFCLEANCWIFRDRRTNRIAQKTLFTREFYANADYSMDNSEVYSVVSLLRSHECQSFSNYISYKVFGPFTTIELVTLFHIIGKHGLTLSYICIQDCRLMCILARYLWNIYIVIQRSVSLHMLIPFIN